MLRRVDCHVLRKEDGHVSRKALELEVDGQRKTGRKGNGKSGWGIKLKGWPDQGR